MFLKTLSNLMTTLWMLVVMQAIQLTGCIRNRVLWNIYHSDKLLT
jgi:hypothetical protein